VSHDDVHRTIDALWRIESPRLIAGLVRVVGDVGVAEELAQDALLAALEQWPEEGVPRNPGAWLMTSAKHRALDHVRRRAMLERKHAELGRDLDAAQPQVEDQLADAIDDDIGDDVLRLIFTACHPLLSVDARVALTLRLLGGLSTGEIARAFLTTEATVAQRIVRAKRTLSEARVPFEVPRGVDRAERLEAVLGVIYLIFNEGYSATAGDDWVRPALCEDAARLGRVLAGLMREEPEVHALVALMELQASRLRARVGADGAPILLLDQDRTRWDHLLIRRGVAALARCHVLGGALGPYALQASIAACHAEARSGADTDWGKIAGLYAVLAQVAPSPVVELNRAVAVGMSDGPAAALAIVDAVAHEKSLNSYHYLATVRGDLLEKLGRGEEARREFERAAALTSNARERALLLARAAGLGRALCVVALILLSACRGGAGTSAPPAAATPDRSGQTSATREPPPMTLPDALEAGWGGQPVCEQLVDDAWQRVLRCAFPPGTGHERHYHLRHAGYALQGGRMRITDSTGTREVDLVTGSSYTSSGIAWHEVFNVGSTTVRYLIIEAKPAPSGAGPGRADRGERAR